VVPLTGAIEGRVSGEIYRVSPRIRITQAKIPAEFVKRMELSNGTMLVVDYILNLDGGRRDKSSLKLGKWCGRRDSNPGSRLFPDWNGKPVS